MKALLLAAGYGSRLRPITDTIPKCLVDINGRPLLDLWLERLDTSSVSEILINTHYLPKNVIDFVSKSKFSGKVQLSYEPELLGTCGTILHNLEFIGSDPLLLIHADNLSVFSVDDFYSCHKSRPPCCDITMMTFESDDPKSCGIVEIDQRKIVTQLFEKVANPPHNLANAAVYILENSLVQFLARQDPKPSDFSTEVLPRLLGRIHTYHNSCYHRDIGTVYSLVRAREEIRKFAL